MSASMGKTEWVGIVRRRWRGLQRGQSMLIVAVAMIALLGFIAFAVDTGSLYLHRTWLGQAVDSASLAAGYELPNVQGACARVVEYMEVNDYRAGDNVEYSMEFSVGPDAFGADPGPFTLDTETDSIRSPADCGAVTVPPEHTNVHYLLRVSARQTVSTLLMGLFGYDSIGVALPGAALRSPRYDVALVIDRSGSMNYDTCRPPATGPDTSCQNRYINCTLISPSLSDDFESYSSLANTSPPWTYSDQVVFSPTQGVGSSKAIQVKKSGGTAGNIYRNFDTTGLSGNLFLMFWAKDGDSETGNSEKLRVGYRVNPAAGFSPAYKMSATDLTSEWAKYGALLPPGTENTPDLQIQFAFQGGNGKSAWVDQVYIASCNEQAGPWLWYRSDMTYEEDNTDDGCAGWLSPARACSVSDPWPLAPGRPWNNNFVYANLMQQPMNAVIDSAQVFVDLIASRQESGSPQDLVGLVAFHQTSIPLVGMVTDYGLVKGTLETGIWAEFATNIGGGMRDGLDLLDTARSGAIHIMVLLTDGSPNRYDDTWEMDERGALFVPTVEGIACTTPNSEPPCLESLTYVKAQTQRAVESNVAIYAIGLGSKVQESFDGMTVFPGNITGMELLEYVSQQTGGEAYYAASVDELAQIFEWIAKVTFVRLAP